MSVFGVIMVRIFPHFPLSVSVKMRENTDHNNSEYGSLLRNVDIMLPKTSPYVKRYDGQTKRMYFLIEDDELLENIILFGTKSALI